MFRISLNRSSTRSERFYVSDGRRGTYREVEDILPANQLIDPATLAETRLYVDGVRQILAREGNIGP